MADSGFSENDKSLLLQNGFNEEQIQFLYNNQLRNVYFIINSLKINSELDKDGETDSPAKMIERINEFNKKYDAKFYTKKMDEILTKIDKDEEKDDNLKKPVLLKFMEKNDNDSPIDIESTSLDDSSDMPELEPNDS